MIPTVPIDQSDKIDFIRLLNTWNSYLGKMHKEWPTPAMIFVAVLLAAVLWYLLDLKKRAPGTYGFLVKRLPSILLVGGLGTGLYLAFSKAFLCDDAYISLTYARNLAEGNGLVLNSGERVEGITNFLWTVTIALISLAVPLEMPLIAVGLALLCFGANLIVVYFIGRRLARQTGAAFYLPISVALMSVQGILTNYGTSGLETSAAALLVDLGLFFLIAPPAPKASFLSGLMFILATLTRPDHAIFFVAAGCAEAYRLLRNFFERRENHTPLTFGILKNAALFSAPFLLYLAFLAWRYAYYGDLVPNTYYTKSVDLSYIAQGIMYVQLFYLENYFFIPMLFFLVWLAWPSRVAAVNVMKVFVLVSTVLYHYYILKIGGCFMNGRFFVSLIPMIFLTAEQVIHRLLGIAGTFRKLRAGIGVFALAFLSMGAIRVVFPRVENSWGFIFDEYIPCRISSWFPLRVIHFSYPMAHRLKELLWDRGLTPTISTHGIGMIAYYSHLETIDQLGLTDPYVAKLPIETRGPSGHEKHAPFEYLQKRGVIMGRTGTGVPPHLSNLPRINWGPGLDDGWSVVTYDRKWISKIRKKSPEIKFMDFEWYFDKKYLPETRKMPFRQLLTDLMWFKKYYFNYNDDPVRYNKLLDIIEERAQPDAPLPGADPVCSARP